MPSNSIMDLKLPLAQYHSAECEIGEYEYDGCFYESAVSLVQIGLFNMCMCHDAEANLRYVRDGLLHIAERAPKGNDETYTQWCNDWRERGYALFGNHPSREFFFYWADSEDLTNHGSATPGWLSDKGKYLVALIDDALAEDARQKTS